jgi:hypothetical protein
MLFTRSVVLVKLSIYGAASISLLASLGPLHVTDLGAHKIYDHYIKSIY